MSLRKRGSVWWIDFAAPDGERIRRSAETGNKAQAQELHDKLKSEVWRLQRLGDRPRRIWQDAAVRWLHEQSHKATHEDDKAKLRWLDRFLAGRELETINRALIDTITEAKRAEGCANGTINRTLALLRAILRRCVREWEWMDRSPAIRLLKEPSRRIRFLTHDQAMAVVARVAIALAGHGRLHALDRASPGERDRASLGAGRFGAPARVGTPGSGQRAESHWCSLERHGDGARACASGQASGTGVHLRRQARCSR